MQSSTPWKVVGISIVLVFAFLGYRLFQLQMVMGAKYSDLSERNAIRIISVPAPRGIITDRKGVPLVESRMAYRIFLDTRDLGDHPENEYALIKELLQLGDTEFDALLNNPKRRSFEPIVLLNDADAVTVSRISEHKHLLPGVSVEEFPTRQYIRQDTASHLIGYLGEIDSDELAAKRDKGYHMGDLVGKSGVEKVYEEYLKGIDGGLQVEVNNLGNPIRTLGMKEPIAGNNVALTIDLKLQKAAEDAFKEHLNFLQTHNAPNATSGAVVAMDVNTGELLAMLSWPDYDPSVFVGHTSRTEIAKLFTSNLQPTMNRAISGVYPYGSTFKMITAMAALEENKVNSGSRWSCYGYDLTYHKKKCWTVGKGIIHGSQDLIHGIKNSCNIVFYELGRLLGPDKLGKWANNFGFGSKTGIELYGEREGLVPSSEWKKKVYRYPWYPMESMDFGIGQGYMSGTPLQLARAYCALLNGGKLLKPQIVKSITGADGKVIETKSTVVQDTVPFHPKNASLVREGLRLVVAEGTARGPFVGFPISAGGKTGTAQNPPADNHGWFVGFAPADHPKIVVVVLVEHGKSGSGGAAPIGRKVLDSYFNVQQVKTEQPNVGMVRTGE